ncbi:MAG: small multi-drug export protein [Campylobacterota bacterium]|nr:small multi-drug export protein [Campylobacterota bacterium]
MFALLQKLTSNAPGRILLLAGVLLLSGLVCLGLVFVVDPILAKKLFAMVVTNYAVGRVPSLSLGYAANLPHFMVIGTNYIAEMMLVLVLYPLFALSFNRQIKIKSLQHFFEKVTLYKKKHQHMFDKYGVVGLFGFVFIPFWMTGPIVGSMIGYLIGIGHFTTISIIAIATLIAISLWGLFLQEIIDFLMVFNQPYAWVGLGVVIAIFIFIGMKKN